MTHEGPMQPQRDRGADDGSSSDYLRDLEHKRLRALVDGDIEVAAALHAADFQLITPNGDALSKEQYLRGIAAGDLTYLVFEPVSSIAVRVAGQMAVIRYESQIEIIVGGAPVPRARYWHTDLYEERDGQWQAVWSQATYIQDV